MPPSPIPAPLPPWARFLIQVAPFIPAALQEALEFIGVLNHASDPNPGSWMHVQMIGEPSGAIESADRFVTTFDIVNITNGVVDGTWTSTDFNNVTSNLGQLADDWAAQMQPGYVFTELRYYQRAFNDMGNPKPFSVSGPPAFIAPIPTVPGGTTHQASQISLTSTDKTTYPRHWGRNYWPMPAPSFGPDGRHVQNTSVDALCAAVHTCYQNLMGGQFYPVVAVTQVDKVATRGLLGITSVQVDDVYDVTRRRRPFMTTYRKVLGLP